MARLRIMDGLVNRLENRHIQFTDRGGFLLHCNPIN